MTMCASTPLSSVSILGKTITVTFKCIIHEQVYHLSYKQDILDKIIKTICEVYNKTILAVYMYNIYENNIVVFAKISFDSFEGH